MKQRRYLAVAGVAAAALVMSACSTGSGADAPNQEIDKSKFAEETYGGLSGKSIAYLEGSGGVMADSLNSTMVANFEDVAGVSVQHDFNVDFTVFMAAAEAGNPPWSFVQFPSIGDYLRARDAGLLAPLDTNKVNLDKLEDGTYDEYGYYSGRYAANLAYNTDSFSEGSGPSSAIDFFDTEKFPGKRCLFDFPQLGGTLELALIADGVPHEDLCPIDMDRALAKLDTIRDDTVWYSDGDSGIRYLSSGECDMGTVWSGRAFNAVTKDDAPIEMIWTDAMYTDSVNAVPANAPEPEAGQAFAAFFLDDTDGYIQHVNDITYTQQMVDVELSDYDPVVQDWLATGENLNEAYEEDAEWYSENINEVLDTFNRWLAQ